MNILFLGRYDNRGASSRYRLYQYLPFFKKKGVEYRTNFIIANGGLNKTKLQILYTYSKRLFLLLFNREYKILYLEKEFFPFFFDFIFIFKFLKIKYIVDFDDAIFHNYDLSKNYFIRTIFKNKIKRIITNANAVVTGSPYLTSYALKYNKNVLEIPTSIIFEKYNRKAIKTTEKFVIGWIGSKSTSLHLLSIKDVLLTFLDVYKCELHLIGFDSDLAFLLQSSENVKIINWEEEKEVECIYQFDVGIMPLPNEPFEQGKCGLKLIQYMACGVPTISTPLEANVKINRQNFNLFATTNEEWLCCLKEVFFNLEKYKSVGKQNIAIVKEYYSVEANVNQYISLFNRI